MPGQTSHGEGSAMFILKSMTAEQVDACRVYTDSACGYSYPAR